METNTFQIPADADAGNILAWWLSGETNDIDSGSPTGSAAPSPKADSGSLSDLRNRIISMSMVSLAEHITFSEQNPTATIRLVSVQPWPDEALPALAQDHVAGILGHTCTAGWPAMSAGVVDPDAEAVSRWAALEDPIEALVQEARPQFDAILRLARRAAK